MAHRDELIAFADDLLDAHSWDDYGPNGLQVWGREDVGRIATGVSAHRELFERAGAYGAGLVLCHHGLFWGGGPMTVGPLLRRRLEALFQADASLAAYHLPLDAHPDIGNNALICQALGLRRGRPFGEARGRAIGFVGEVGEPMDLDVLVDRCREAFGRDPLVLEGDGRRIASVGIVSGGGGSSLGDAAREGLDALVTGEPEEPAMADARETGVALIAGGHYATETFGIRRLGEAIAERFGVEHEFIEVPNPV